MFYITISNGLLEGDHRKRMGMAVWEYMWLIDKVTRIDEDGMGWVLGGKPINLADLSDGVTTDTVSRNLQKLKRAGYITMRHTPYGIVVKVVKAKKRFGKNVEPTSAKMPNPHRKDAEPNIRQDSIQDSKTSPARSAEDWKEEVKVFDLFEPVNPHYKILFKRKQQHEAVRRLLKMHGFEMLEKIIAFLPKSNASQYAPTITTPCELEERFGKLAAFVERQKNKAPIIAI